MIVLSAMVVVLAAVVVGQLYMISNLDDRNNELEADLLDVALTVGQNDGCLSGRIDRLESGVPADLEPGEVVPC